jgi:protein-disulfide isomerase
MNRTKMIAFLLSVVLVLTVINLYATFQVSGKVNALTGGAVAAPSPRAAPTPTQAAPPTPSAPVDVSEDDDAVIGDDDAPVTIIEFSDYECPFCGRFYSQTYGQLKEQYIDTGKAKLVFRDFPLSFHQNAQKAHEAAECAGDQDAYFEMHDMVFENQQSLSVSALKGYAGQIGLDQVTFDECLDSGTHAAEVQQDFRDGQAAGVSGTPTFFVNGVKLVGAQPFSAFQQAIDAELS